MGTGQAGKGMGSQSSAGHQGAGEGVGKRTEEDELTTQLQGNNQLEGNDQSRAHNQRQTLPDEKAETEGVVESFQKSERRKP